MIWVATKVIVQALVFSPLAERLAEREDINIGVH